MPRCFLRLDTVKALYLHDVGVLWVLSPSPRGFRVDLRVWGEQTGVPRTGRGEQTTRNIEAGKTSP